MEFPKQQFDRLSILLRSSSTVFTFTDIALLWRESSPMRLTNQIARYIKKGELMRIRRGLYAKDKNYERLEVATKLYSPSYVSMETVLLREGVIFQYYETIFSVSYLTREVRCDEQKYAYRKIKNSILLNSTGVLNKGTYSIATKERAFLDMIYFHKNYYFDNTRQIDWGKCFEMISIYGSKEMKRALDSHYKDHKEKYA